MLLKHRTVMAYDSEGRYWVMFLRPREEAEEVDESVFFDIAHWREMGNPDTITVTIEPGDKLNS